MGGILKLQYSFLQETDQYSGLCDQERYRDGASMRELSKDSTSCHALFHKAPKNVFNTLTAAKFSRYTLTRLIVKAHISHILPV